jgi:hypothetical protein
VIETGTDCPFQVAVIETVVVAATCEVVIENVLYDGPERGPQAPQW